MVAGVGVRRSVHAAMMLAELPSGQVDNTRNTPRLLLWVKLTRYIRKEEHHTEPFTTSYRAKTYQTW